MSTTSKPAAVRRIQFRLPYLPAQKVTLAGSFNHWDPDKLALQDVGGQHWEIEVSLPAGTYEYLFVVDGRWMTDPNNSQTVPNGFGRYNSVITVPASRSRKTKS
jgi:1,4-alpha-glucan branching enzyme